MSILWTIIIGFIAGVIAKFIMPGDNEPSGFILTAILGIIGAFVATYLGQAPWMVSSWRRCRPDRSSRGCDHCVVCLRALSWRPQASPLIRTGLLVVATATAPDGGICSAKPAGRGCPL
jgi:uncharacterized membrane protein YeaQ/YmgE (transglycosylase-associated protein family)